MYMSKDTLGDRMKGHESVPKNFLMRWTPVIIRLDGRAFHSFTKRQAIKDSLTVDPFSEIMKSCMVYTTQLLCSQIQNVKVGYTQSDEISLLLTDWDTNDTQQWFGGNIQKIVSLSAAIATNAFNHTYETYERMAFCESKPMFDSRVFNLPKEEVTNYFIWRQQDASRNSVSMTAQYHFSHKELHKKSNSDKQDMLMLQKGVNWNDIDTWKKRGTCVTKQEIDKGNGVIRSSWVPDMDIPIFTQDRDYIERFLK
jgi:tRNA(His) guanylyltransferase